MSLHEILVVRLKQITKHPNADTLGIVEIFGWTCIIRLDDFKEGDLVTYIPPDYVCPDTAEYEFLGEKKRIKVRKLRGVLSQGLVTKAPEGSKEGDNVIDILGIKRYEPPIELKSGGETEKPPNIWIPVYDVESFNRYPNIIKEGEQVVITEKIHGANARFVYHNNKMYAGSRTEWKRQDDTILWWNCLKQNPVIEKFCKKNPDKVLFGEVFGQVQDLKYGSKKGQLFFVAFDILDTGKWLPFELFYDEAYYNNDVTIVPILFTGAFSSKLAKELAEGESLWLDANHLREGVVIRPFEERTDPEIGRVQLKLVSNRYLERG